MSTTHDFPTDEAREAWEWAWAHPADTAFDRLTLVCLAWVADRNFEADVAISEIARMTCSSVRSVGRSLQRLESSGALWRRAQFYSDGGRASNLYRLNVRAA